MGNDTDKLIDLTDTGLPDEELFTLIPDRKSVV